MLVLYQVTQYDAHSDELTLQYVNLFVYSVAQFLLFYASATVSWCWRYYVFMSSCLWYCFRNICDAHWWIFTKLLSV